MRTVKRPYGFSRVPDRGSSSVLGYGLTRLVEIDNFPGAWYMSQGRPSRVMPTRTTRPFLVQDGHSHHRAARRKRATSSPVSKIRGRPCGGAPHYLLPRANLLPVQIVFFKEF